MSVARAVGGETAHTRAFSCLGKLEEVCAVARVRRLRDAVINEVQPVFEQVANVKVELCNGLERKWKAGNGFEREWGWPSCVGRVGWRRKRDRKGAARQPTLSPR